LAYDLAICLYFVEGNHDEELWKHELAWAKLTRQVNVLESEGSDDAV
jgi:hypothetical protein